MDPIKTAVKVALVPLRVAVQLGESFVGSDESRTPQAAQPQAAPSAAAQPSASASSAASGSSAAKTTSRRSGAKQATRSQAGASSRRAGPQATRAPKPMGDANIARKVESVIFRDPQVPKGDIDVNVVDGIVWLRGEAPHPEMIEALEAQCVAIPEVVRVENLIHLPKTPAPTRTDIFERERKTRETKPRSSIVEDRPLETRKTSERKPTVGEPSPRELARQRKGRQPAPLGASDGNDKPS